MLDTTRRVVVAIAVSAALLLAGLVLQAPSASAHDVLISTDPVRESTSTKAPAQVRLTFDKPALALGTEIRVTGPDGTVVSAGKARLVDSDVTQELAGVLPAGAYTVTWRVTSADGHPVSGTFGFRATSAGQGALASLPPNTAGTHQESAGESSADDSSGSLLLLLVGAAVLLVAGGIAGLAIRRRRRGDAP